MGEQGRHTVEEGDGTAREAMLPEPGDFLLCTFAGDCIAYFFVSKQREFWDYGLLTSGDGCGNIGLVFK